MTDENIEKGPLSDLEMMALQGLFDATDLGDNDQEFLEAIESIDTISYAKKLGQKGRRTMMTYLLGIFDGYFEEFLEEGDEETLKHTWARAAAMGMNAFFAGYGVRDQEYRLPQEKEE